MKKAKPKMNSGLKFFKLITTCQKMVIPAAVIGQIPGVERVVLRNGYGDMWIVGMVIDGYNGEWSFKEGWPRFYKDNSLNPNDFLVFNYNPAPPTSTCVFDFKILGQNSCEKNKDVQEDYLNDHHGNDDENYVKGQEPEPEPEPDQLNSESRSRPPNNRPFFISKLPSRKTELFIPKHVMVNYKLKLPERLFLVDVQGNKWETVVKEWKNGRVCCTGGGWRRLCNANNIDKDTTYACELILQGRQHPCILVRVLDLKTASTSKKAVKKKRGSSSRQIFVSRSRPRRHELGIPKEAIKDYNLKLPNALLLVDERGNKWKTNVKKWKDGRVMCNGGWRSLCNVNNIKKNDTCICEFFLEADHPFILVRPAPRDADATLSL